MLLGEGLSFLGLTPEMQNTDKIVCLEQWSPAVALQAELHASP